MHKENQSDVAIGEDRFDDAGPVVLVSTIAPRAGRALELLYGEVAAMYGCAESHSCDSSDSGILATRLYHSLSGDGIMLMQTFDSMKHYREWSCSSGGKFASERLKSMAERVEQSFYRLFYRD